MPETMTDRENRPALRTANPADRVPLRGVRLRSRLAGMSQKTTLEQTFVNLEDRAIEAVYTFPLPEGVAVCGFEVFTDDRVLTGKIEETGQAIDKYEGAVSEGHGAFLLEQDRPDIFTIRVGNLKPRQAVTIRLTFVGSLEIAERAIRIAFPTTVAPRYVTAAGEKDPLEAFMDGDAVNPPHELHVPYGLHLEVDVALGRPIKTIASPSHAIEVQERAAGEYRITLAGGSAAMDRDVVLTFAMHHEQQPCIQAATGPGGAQYLAVTFMPEFDEGESADAPASETIFVLDCSGSMQGESIAQAKAALELCLRSLAEGDTFNVCLFGSKFEMLASEPLRYTDQTLAKALAYVQRAGDLGGTELHAPLDAIFKSALRIGLVRNLIVLTDGEVSNEAALMDLARQHRAHNRIFSFGIGAACSAHLVKGLARSTGGVAEFITARERIEDKVLRTFGRLASPMVSDVEMEWGGADVQTLAELPPVFDGEVLTVFGRCAGALPREVALKCNTAAGPRRWPLVVPASTADDGIISTMWARRSIQSLEEVNGVRRTSVSQRRESRAGDMLIQLSKDFSLLCSLTSFIAVEHRSLAERNEGQPELRRVPVQLAKDWGGIAMGGAGGRGGGPPMAPAPMAAPYQSFAPPSAASGMDYDASLGDPLLDAISQSTAGFMPRPASPPSAPPKGFLGFLGKRRKSAGSDAAERVREFNAKRLAKPADSSPAPTPVTPPMSHAAEEAQSGAPRDPGEDLRDLLNSQSAGGSFAESAAKDKLLAEMGRDSAVCCKRVEELLPASLAGAEREGVIRTAVVLFLLAQKFTADEPLWRRAKRKACQYLGKVMNLNAADVGAWLKQTTEKLTA